jgi:enoyl-CoA hydratase/carnithine racemase
MGGGAELATSTDFRVMSPRAKMQFVQSRMGVSCGWGGTSRLVKVGRWEMGLTRISSAFISMFSFREPK